MRSTPIPFTGGCGAFCVPLLALIIVILTMRG